MSEINTGGSAFPVRGHLDVGGPDSYWTQYPSDGMALRDYFAAKAVQGMIASGITVDIAGDHPFQQRAETAYMIADAMLAAKEKSNV